MAERASAEHMAQALLAVLFVRAEPISLAELVGALDSSADQVVSAASLAALLLEGTGLMLQDHLGELQLVSHPHVAWAVERALRPEVASRLSRPALETLAIVAYRQPISRAAIEAIRGVNCDAVIERLLRHDLVAEVGRSEGPGRAHLFGTTMRFLQVAGIARIEDLPPLPSGEDGGWLTRAAEAGRPNAD
ncbi:MAG TPA: SMC-Scp complex subunit ScpB [Candidatus Dormibacteraeota bacterium]|nr:SMC-Scp complex subunit ScpB [Candidatus Dormibacteraeota bacterium]